MASKYDLLIIGSGPGGYVAAIRASQLGMKVGVVERAELGGICLNWGCIPTKALLKSAQVFDYMNHASDYGINISGAKADFKAMVGRSRKVAEGMSKGIQFLFKKNKIDHIQGTGVLGAPKTVDVTDDKGAKTAYQADHIIVATGGRSRELPGLPIDGKKIIGYREAMVLGKQPKHMVIVGSGAIGSEFAYFYNAVGTEVILVEYMDTIVPVEDSEVSKQLERSFKKSGITVKTKSEVTEVDIKSGKCKVKIKSDKGEETIETDVVLSAVGVSGNIENIGLQSAGIVLEKGRIAVDEYYRTNKSGVYAIGDVIKGPWLAPCGFSRRYHLCRSYCWNESRTFGLPQSSWLHLL